MNVEQGHERLKELYGCTAYKWAERSNDIERGKAVKIVIDEGDESLEPAIVDCVAMGAKNKSGEHLLWYQRNGRRWVVTRRTAQILILK